jgi:hypothetical protein
MSASHEALRRLQETTGRRFYWRCVKPNCVHGAACGSGPWIRVFYDDEPELSPLFDFLSRQGER